MGLVLYIVVLFNGGLRNVDGVYEEGFSIFTKHTTIPLETSVSIYLCIASRYQDSYS